MDNIELPDIVERMETSAEYAYDRLVQPDGNFKCSKGHIYDPDEGIFLSANPYAMPSCPICFDEISNQKGKSDDKG